MVIPFSLLLLHFILRFVKFLQTIVIETIFLLFQVKILHLIINISFDGKYEILELVKLWQPFPKSSLSTNMKNCFATNGFVCESSTAGIGNHVLNVASR